MPKMMQNNQKMATAVFFSVITIYLSEKIWTFGAGFFLQIKFTTLTTLAWKEYYMENYNESLKYCFLLWSSDQVSSTQRNLDIALNSSY